MMRKVSSIIQDSIMDDSDEPINLMDGNDSSFEDSDLDNHSS